MVKLGDRIEVIGIGRRFIQLVHGATGFGTVVHVAYQGEVETSDFPNKTFYEQTFPNQMNHGVFYTDEGLGEGSDPLYVDPADVRVIEEESDNEE